MITKSLDSTFCLPVLEINCVNITVKLSPIRWNQYGYFRVLFKDSKNVDTLILTLPEEFQYFMYFLCNTPFSHITTDSYIIASELRDQLMIFGVNESGSEALRATSTLYTLLVSASYNQNIYDMLCLVWEETAFQSENWTSIFSNEYCLPFMHLDPQKRRRILQLLAASILPLRGDGINVLCSQSVRELRNTKTPSDDQVRIRKLFESFMNSDVPLPPRWAAASPPAEQDPQW